MYVIFSVEDDKDIAHIINATLSKQGYDVHTFYDGKSFLNALENIKPDMILLDMMLPDIHGHDLLKKVRSNSIYYDVDIIIISANHMLMDKVDGLDLGADDYIEKPFQLPEFMSRVNAKVRRHKKNKVIIIEDIRLDLDKHTCTNDNKEVLLTSKEFDILSLLFLSRGKVVSRDEILHKIWGNEVPLESRAIDMHIKSLRKKLDDKSGKIISTVYGVGYRVNL